MTTATIRDVAKRAGVGVGTVSRVLNGSQLVSDATRHKVLVAIKDLDYTPHTIARRLSLGKTLTIAVIAPFFTRPSVVERLRGIEQTLADSDYDLILYNVESVSKRDEYFRSVPRRERVDGLLIISLSPTDELVQQLAQAHVPTVLVDTHHPGFCCVIIDDVAGGRKATQHLIDLGHQKIGYISDYMKNPFNFRQIRDRYEGYRQALAAADIAFRPRYHKQGEHSLLAAQRLAHELLTEPDPPTAVFAFSDTQAIGVLEAAQELGLDVPRDLSVIGYDDIEISEYLHLSTVRQSLHESGTEGGRLLLEAISEPNLPPEEILLPTELIVRDTTAQSTR